MRLSVDTDSPDYHDVIHFIDVVTIDGTIIRSCRSIDVAAGEAECFTMPFRSTDGIHVDTHIVKGKVDIVWKPSKSSVFLYCKKDWEEREKRRTIDTGDTVYHGPSGEEWIVAFVRSEMLAWCGWPAGMVKLAECKLVKKATKEERLSLLRTMADIGQDDMRWRYAKQALEEAQ